MLHLETVAPDTLELLKYLLGIKYFEPLRLVGGTALSLQLGHRISVDIDLFGQLIFEKEEVENALQTIPNRIVLRQTKSIYIYNLNGVKVDFVNYTYPWLDEMIIKDGIRMAGLKDIAAMKINAIAGIGSKKDFIDLFYLLKHFSLEEILKFYQKKFPDGNLFLALRSMIYFNDAEDQDVKMLGKATWEQVKEEISYVHYKYIHNE